MKPSRPLPPSPSATQPTWGGQVGSRVASRESRGLPLINFQMRSSIQASEASGSHGAGRRAAWPSPRSVVVLAVAAKGARAAAGAAASSAAPAADRRGLACAGAAAARAGAALARRLAGVNPVALDVDGVGEVVDARLEGLAADGAGHRARLRRAVELHGAGGVVRALGTLELIRHLLLLLRHDALLRLALAAHFGRGGESRERGGADLLRPRKEREDGARRTVPLKESGHR
jgi:hypothetical protein